jgi:hypothetical protein
MKLRHAAALALVGFWAVITPPLKNGIIDTSAPQSAWDLSTFGSSKAGCEEEVARLHRCAAIIRGGPGDAINDCDFPDEEGRKYWKLNADLQTEAVRDAAAKCVWRE